MSIYAKLADARAAFHELKLQKSGENKFQGYKYFELGDFVRSGMDCLRDAGLVPVISFDAAEATMTLHETEGDGSIKITSPMSSAALKGCHDVQNLGAVQTYLRRYLWTAALEIIEHDALAAAKTVDEAKPVDLDAVRARLKAAPDNVAAKASEWIAKKYGSLDKMPPAAVAALAKRLEAA